MEVTHVPYINRGYQDLLIWTVRHTGVETLYALVKNLKEDVWLVVDDEFVGEVCLLEQWQGILVVGYVEGDMGIAAKDNGHITLLAQAQYLKVVAHGIGFIAYGAQG